MINVALSADNAMVIALAAHRLPPAQRRMAMLLGGGLAIFFQIAFTFLATFLLYVPGLMLVGGIVLFFITFKLVSAEKSGNEPKLMASRTVFVAVRTILLASLVMSLDNILAVAGASSGDFRGMVFGLLVSTIFILFCSNGIAALMRRWQWITPLGAGVLAFTACQMVLSSREVAAAFVHGPGVVLSNSWEKWFVTEANLESPERLTELPADFQTKLTCADGKVRWFGPMTAAERQTLDQWARTDSERQAIETMFQEAKHNSWLAESPLAFLAPIVGNKWSVPRATIEAQGLLPATAGCLQFGAALLVPVSFWLRKLIGD